MPSIWKSIMRPKAEPYHFPKAEDLILAEETPVESEPPPPPGEDGGERTPELEIQAAEEAAAPEPEPEPQPDPVSFAQIQAEQIIADAHRRAEAILDQASLEAEIKAK
ncbi:MAG: hypothetical protein K2L38_01155, partial [Dysosmobacter sp.]|nr:hypothetical protein [Dysosmobacter sp.]